MTLLAHSPSVPLVRQFSTLDAWGDMVSAAEALTKV